MNIKMNILLLLHLLINCGKCWN